MPSDTRTGAFPSYVTGSGNVTVTPPISTVSAGSRLRKSPVMIGMVTTVAILFLNVGSVLPGVGISIW